MQEARIRQLICEQSPAVVKAWQEDQSPAVAQRAKAESVEIHWGDENADLKQPLIRGVPVRTKDKPRWVTSGHMAELAR